MEPWAYLVLGAAAVLWGASDALMKHFSPYQLNQPRRKKVDGATSAGSEVVYGLAQDFWCLVRSPGYLACLLANQVTSGNLPNFHYFFILPGRIIWTSGCSHGPPLSGISFCH
jgi:hypothetical protein